MTHYKRPGSRLRRPFILGLTGSIGMGKSTAATMFEREGVPVFDADAEVHRLQGPRGALVAAIEARFPGTTGPRGVDRQELGRRVLGNRHELAALEAIVHPAVGRAQKKFLARHRARDVVVLDIPLLFAGSRSRQARTRRFPDRNRPPEKRDPSSDSADRLLFPYAIGSRLFERCVR